MTRKFLVLLLALAMAISCFSGCAFDIGSLIQEWIGSETQDTDRMEEGQAAADAVSEDIPKAVQDALDQAVIMLVGGDNGYVDGLKTSLGGASPEILDALLYIPAGFVVRGLEGSFTFDPATASAQITLGDRTLEITAGAGTIVSGGGEIPMAGAGFAAGEELMVPADSYCDALGVELVQDGSLVMVGQGLEDAANQLSSEDSSLLYAAMTADLGSVSGIELSAGALAGKPGVQMLEYIIDPSLIPYVTPVETIIAQVGPLYIEDMVVWESDVYEHGYTYGMTIYNYLGYVYGAVEVYDAGDNLVDIEQISPFEGQKSSVAGALSDICWLGWKVAESIEKKDLDHLNHRNTFNSAIQDIEVDVPAGGYIIITCNTTQSPNVAVWNLVHLTVEMFTSIKDIVSKKIPKEDFSAFKEYLKKYLISELTKEPEVLAELAAEFSILVSGINREASVWERADLVNAVWQKILRIFSDLKIDLNTLLSQGISFASGMLDFRAEEIVDLLDGVLGESLDAWKIMNHLFNLANMNSDLSATSYCPAMYMAVRDWREAYATFLKENQSRPGHASYYEEGDGRYTLAYLTDDGIPELLIVDSYDTFMVYTYEDMEVRQLLFANGSSDVVRFPYDWARWSGDGRLLLNGTTGWDVYLPIEHEYIAFVLECELNQSDGQYWFNPYDAELMLADGYSYRMGYEDRPVSAETYGYYRNRYGLFDEDFWRIEPDDLLPITPAGIEEGLGF